MATTTVGTIELLTKIDTSGYTKGAKEINSSSTSMSDGMKNVGGTLTKTLTPAMAVVGAIMLKAGKDWKEGTNAIITGTGASGEALKDMQGIMKGLAGEVPQGMGDIGSAIAEVNTRLGLTGDPLKEMSKRFLDLSRLTGQDVTSSIADMTRVFGDWGIEAQDQVKTMDRIFKASQVTGIGVDILGQKMVQFGAPLRSMGFTIEETTALLGKWEKEGVNTDKILGSLSLAANNFAKAGIPMREGLEKTIDSIKNAKNSSEALAIAQGVVGSRAANDFQAAVREGRFDIDDYVESIEDSEGAIQDAADATLTLTDKIGMLKDGVLANLGPFGELGGVVAGGLAAIGPALFGIGAVIPILANPVFWVIAGILASIAAVALVIRANWDKISPVIDAVKNAFSRFWELIKPLRDFVANQLKSAWEDIKTSFESVKESLEPFMPQLKILAIILGVLLLTPLLVVIATVAIFIATVVAVITVVARVIGWFSKLSAMFWETTGNIQRSVNDRLSSVINFFKELPGKIISALGDVGRMLFDSGKKIIQGLVDGIKNVGGQVKDAVEGVLQSARDLLPFSDAKEGPFSDLTKSGESIFKTIKQGAIKGARDFSFESQIDTFAADSPVLSAADKLTVGADGGSAPNVNINMDGIMARSRADLRDIARDLVDALDEERTARGMKPINARIS